MSISPGSPREAGVTPMWSIPKSANSNASSTDCIV